MKKKLVAIMLALGLVLGMAGAAYATPGYQLVTTWSVNMNKPMPDSFTTNARTLNDGGYVQIQIANHNIVYGANTRASAMLVEVWEDDGATGDDFIGQAWYYPSEMNTKSFYFNTSGYGDGIGLKPEVYVKLTSTYDSTAFNLNMYN